MVVRAHRTWTCDVCVAACGGGYALSWLPCRWFDRAPIAEAGMYIWYAGEVYGCVRCSCIARGAPSMLTVPAVLSTRWQRRVGAPSALESAPQRERQPSRACGACWPSRVRVVHAVASN